MGVGAFFSGIANVLTGGVIEKGVAIIDKLVVDKDLREKLNAEFRTTQFVTEMALEQAKLESETQIQVAQEVTHQAELNQSDLYTKQTRPKIARQSWFVSGAYAITCFVSEFVVTMIRSFAHLPPEVMAEIHGIAFQPEIYLAAAAPALTYMGVRSFDIWRAGGAKKI